MLSERLKHPLAALAFALLLTAPWVGVEFAGGPDALGLPPLATVAVSGVAVLGSSFLLAWAAETAEEDVPQAFAIAVLAVLAVAPEYAVDALYAWTAGANVGTERGVEAANLAVANMTGANRILIGLGWSGIAIFTVYRALSSEDAAVERRGGLLASRVQLDRNISTEITFLLVATVFAFFVPLNGGIGVLDTVFLVGLYVAYIGIVIRGDVEPPQEQVGVPAYLQERARNLRIPIVLALFAYSGAMIFTAVHPFAHGLETLGEDFGVPAFFMIQWIAPLASESPELIVVAYLVNKARSTAGFNALISSKLNQWTLLIGTLAVVYSIAAGQVGTLPFDHKQTAEIWITAAQSAFALAVLANFNISLREAVTLLVLFVSQVVAEYYVIQTVASEARATELSIQILYAYTAVYLALAAVLFWLRRDSLQRLVQRTLRNASAAFSSTPAAEADD
ncbi:sodium:calcium antiporter [Halobacterium litoreum]|uniref:Sodium:calcium antiporter n=1 Tax=Halobacterium litoreum TaxID=2039234 RepID=A0ABD5NHY0_9EURY|nr:sodium:calcium antiporter [Halobacterium litoreum]UHH12665.1 sodium:calcium antiporter [Halobacterium litoreum]